jgi:hypothetical protein
VFASTIAMISCVGSEKPTRRGDVKSLRLQRYRATNRLLPRPAVQRILNIEWAEQTPSGSFAVVGDTCFAPYQERPTRIVGVDRLAGEEGRMPFQ